MPYSNKGSDPQMTVYCVVNIDIVNSRKIIDRKYFQEQLKLFFKNLSDEYEENLVAPITLTLGDEWQIVLRDIKLVYTLYLKVRKYMSAYQVKCYYGIGIGTISTQESDDTRAMDGEAFINARESLNLTKANKNNFKKLFPSKGYKIHLQGPKCELMNQTNVQMIFPQELTLNRVINNLIQNNENLLSRMTPKQQQIIDLYEELGTYQAVTLAIPELNKGRISEKIASSNYWLIKSNIELLSQLLIAYETQLKEVYHGN